MQKVYNTKTTSCWKFSLPSVFCSQMLHVVPIKRSIKGENSVEQDLEGAGFHKEYDIINQL